MLAAAFLATTSTASAGGYRRFGGFDTIHRSRATHVHVIGPWGEVGVIHTYPYQTYPYRTMNYPFLIVPQYGVLPYPY